MSRYIMRNSIIKEADRLLMQTGYNAFSYKTITERIDIKTSSIHYHFPKKSDLGIAIIQAHQDAFEETILRTKDKTPLEKILKLFLYYRRLAAEQKVCIVGALTSDINTLDEKLREKVLAFAESIVRWTATILEEGEHQKVFKPISSPHLKAKILVSTLMALTQLARIENSNDSFEKTLEVLLDEIILKNNI